VIADPTSLSLEGETTLTCVVLDGNPRNYVYLWRFGEEVLVGQITSAFRLSSFTLEKVGVYTCEVTNLGGRGMDSIDIRLDGELLPWFAWTLRPPLSPQLRLSPE
jgi:hypothetical protein